MVDEKFTKALGTTLPFTRQNPINSIKSLAVYREPLVVIESDLNMIRVPRDSIVDLDLPVKKFNFIIRVFTTYYPYFVRCELDGKHIHMRIYNTDGELVATESCNTTVEDVKFDKVVQIFYVACFSFLLLLSGRKLQPVKEVINGREMEVYYV